MTTNAYASHINATSGKGNTVDFNTTQRVITFQVVPAGTITGGTVGLELSIDGTTWFEPPTAAITNLSGATVANPYVLVSATNGLFAVANVGARFARTNIIAAVTGTGASVTTLISGV